MRRKIVSMCFAALLVGGLSMTSIQEAKASDEKVVDGSRLTYENEAVGYDTKITRGTELLTGYSKVTKLGKGKIYAGGTTIATHVVDNVQIAVIVERAKEDDDVWHVYDTWQKKNLNADRVASNRTLYVDGDYYYRVRCLHSANGESSSSFTNGIYIE